MATKEAIAIREETALNKIRDILRIGEWNKDRRMGFILELEQIASALENVPTNMAPVEMAVEGFKRADAADLMDALGMTEAAVAKVKLKVE